MRALFDSGGTIPRLTLDISWADLAQALVPARDDGHAAIIAAWPHDRTALPVLSVRTALDAFLETRRWPAGDTVLMSALNIRSMAEIVEAHGLTVAPVDIELATLAPTLEGIARAITPRTRAYVHAHLCGTSNDLVPHAALCRSHGVTLIEDCAQAFAGDAFAGCPSADLSLFSFGPIKTATALGGAVVLVRDGGVAEAMRARLAGYPPMPEAWFIARILKHAALKLLSAPLLYRGLLASIGELGGDAEALIGRASRGFNRGDLLPQLRHGMPAHMTALLARRLRDGAHVGWRVAAGQAIATQLAPGIDSPGRAAARNVYWLMPVLARNPGALLRALTSAGFDATQGTTSMRALGDAAAVPNATRFVQQVVYLPLSPLMRRNDLQRLADVVNAS